LLSRVLFSVSIRRRKEASVFYSTRQNCRIKLIENCVFCRPPATAHLVCPFECFFACLLQKNVSRTVFFSVSIRRRKETGVFYSTRQNFVKNVSRTVQSPTPIYKVIPHRSLTSRITTQCRTT